VPALDTPIFRLSRGPADPFSPPDWSFALEDGTFGNRFDDPSGLDGRPPEERFRIIYCATQRTAAFGECVARFRPSLTLLAQLGLIDDEEPLDAALAGTVDPDNVERGLIPADWRLRRRMGKTLLYPWLPFVDIADAQSINYLRVVLAPLAHDLGLSDIDLSSLTSQQRRFTQGCARHIYDQSDAQNEPRYAGIRYLSRLNPEWECWAIFSDHLMHAPGWPSFPESIHADVPDLLTVASLFGLTIEVLSGAYLRP